MRPVGEVRRHLQATCMKEHEVLYSMCNEMFTSLAPGESSCSFRIGLHLHLPLHRAVHGCLTAGGGY